MSTMQASLVLGGEASGLVAAGREGQGALANLNRSIDDTERNFKSAKASAEVFTRALDRQETEVNQLRAGLDPLYAATRRLEAGQELLTRAYASGAISAVKYEATLELLQTQHRQTTMAIEMQSAAVGRLTTRTHGGAGGMQNFSYQLQDIFTQVGMGVPLMISLGQQAPQILSGFGAVGAILGVVAAGALPLAAAIFGLGYDTDRTKDKILTAEDMISEALSKIGDAQATLRENSVSNLDAINDKYGEVTASVLGLLVAQNEVAVDDAMTSVGEGLAATLNEFGNSDIGAALEERARAVEHFRNRIEQKEIKLPLRMDTVRAEGEIEDLREALETVSGYESIAKTFDVGEGKLALFDVLRVKIQAALDAGNTTGLLDAIETMRATLQRLPDGPLRDMLSGIVSNEDALRQALHTAELNEETQREIERLLTSIGDIDISSNLAAAADQASRIANELSRAVTNAIALASQGVGGLERARINYEFREDPLGRAGALAGAEFDSRADLPSGTDSTIRNVVEAERREFVSARVEAERYNQQLAAWRKTQRTSERSGGGSRGGGVATDRDRERIIADIERQLDRLAPSYERDLEALNAWREQALEALDPVATGYEAFATDVEMIFEERLAEAYRKDLERREDWASGVERALLNINDDLLSWADVSENITSNWLEGGEEAFVQFVKTGKFEIGDLIDYTIEQFARLAYQQALQPALSGVFDFLSGIIGGIIAPGGAGNSAPAMTHSHAGSTIGTAGVQRSYGTDAPLRADERLTVTTLGQKVFTPEQIANGATVVDALAMAANQSSAGAGQVQISQKFIVENRSSTPVQGEIQETVGPGGQRQHKLVLSDAVGDALTRPGGGARRVMSKTYGVQPTRVRR